MSGSPKIIIENTENSDSISEDAPQKVAEPPVEYTTAADIPIDDGSESTHRTSDQSHSIESSETPHQSPIPADTTVSILPVTTPLRPSISTPTNDPYIQNSSLASIPPPPSTLLNSKHKPGYITFFVCHVGHNGHDRQTEYQCLRLNQNATAADLREKLVDEFDMPAYLQSLWLRDDEDQTNLRWKDLDVDDGIRLRDMGIQDGCTVALTRI
jgi:hypothetical protein